MQRRRKRTAKTYGSPKGPWEPLVNEPIPTAGERLSDGSLIEIVRDPSDATRAMLLRRVEKQVTIAHEIYADDRIFVPAIFDLVLLRQLRLPCKDLPCGPTQALVDQISSILMKTVGLAAENAFLVAVFAVASFFPDCLLTRLCLLLLGSTNTEAIALLRVLSWFCWHPLLLLDDGGIDQLPENLIATRFFYAPRISAQLRKLISNLQASGFGVIRNGLLLESHGAVVIYSGSTDLGCGGDDACLRIPVAPAGRLLRPYEEELYRDIADEIRAKLLNYRLVNYDAVRCSEFDVAALTGPTRELARGLGACLIDAPDLRERLIALLRFQAESVRMERSAEMSPTLESLIVSCHERRRPAVYVGAIAKTATDILSARGESTTLSPKEVGNKLKLLGLHTTRLDAGGRGLKLTRGVCARIHQLARDFGVPAIEKGLPGCPDCKQILDQQPKSAHRARRAHDAHRAPTQRRSKADEAKCQ